MARRYRVYEGYGRSEHSNGPTKGEEEMGRVKSRLRTKLIKEFESTEELLEFCGDAEDAADLRHALREFDRRLTEYIAQGGLSEGQRETALSIQKQWREGLSDFFEGG